MRRQSSRAFLPNFAPLAIIICAAIALLAPRPALAENYPPGAWAQSCQDARMDGEALIASCKDGNRYHVYVDGSGRVVVKKL